MLLSNSNGFFDYQNKYRDPVSGVDIAAKPIRGLTFNQSKLNNNPNYIKAVPLYLHLR